MKNEKGIALTLVMVAVLVLSAIASYALVLGFNHKTVMTVHVKNRTQAYYSAHAGAVDANWRIRSNVLTNNDGKTVINGKLVYTGTGAMNFTNPGWDPAPYCVHMDDTPANNDIHPNTQTVGGKLRCNPDTDILVDISEQGQTSGLRTIESTGHTADV